MRWPWRRKRRAPVICAVCGTDSWAGMSGGATTHTGREVDIHGCPDHARRVDYALWLLGPTEGGASLERVIRAWLADQPGPAPGPDLAGAFARVVRSGHDPASLNAISRALSGIDPHIRLRDRYGAAVVALDDLQALGWQPPARVGDGS
jgi:hypothetical protein